MLTEALSGQKQNKKAQNKNIQNTVNFNVWQRHLGSNTRTKQNTDS